jgi:uncharacterized membrane protein
MKTSRLEAFSDGVLAIIITIMVLELKVPHAVELAALKPLLPVFLSYVLSFIYLGIYWNNHHHLFQVAREVSSGILWANLHLLFWLSLFPFTTGWMGENHLASIPTAVYGFVLLMAAIAYYILQCAIIAKPAQWTLCPYVNLVPMVVIMMTVVAVVTMAAVPVVRWPIIVAIVRIWSVVSIRIISVSVTRIANSDRNLSIRTLHGNESQSTCHQCN